jgi:hypothetical protein
VVGSYEHGNEPSVSLGGGSFLTSRATLSSLRTLLREVRKYPWADLPLAGVTRIDATSDLHFMKVRQLSLRLRANLGRMEVKIHTFLSSHEG